MPEETESAGKTAKKQPLRKLIRMGENIPTYYVNNTEVGMTTWDITLRLSRIEKADSEALYLRDQAMVTMSLQHAKAVTHILATYIAQYEKDNGLLAVPIPGAGLIEPSREIEVELPTGLFPTAVQPETKKE